MMKILGVRLIAASALLLLAACGGQNNVSTQAAERKGAEKAVDNDGDQAKKRPVLRLGEVNLAQTHVLPPEGIVFSDNAAALVAHHHIAERDALALIRITSENPQDPAVEVWHNNSLIDSVALNAPNRLPPSEPPGDAYGTDIWSAKLKGAWLKPGIELRVSARNYVTSAPIAPVISAPTTLSVRVLPIRWKGVPDDDLVKGVPNEAIVAELQAKLPVAKLEVKPYPIPLVLTELPLPPDTGRATTLDLTKGKALTPDEKAQVTEQLLTLLSGIRAANGDALTNTVLLATAKGIEREQGGEWFEARRGVALADAGGFNRVFFKSMLGALDATVNESDFPNLTFSQKASRWGYDPLASRLLNVQLPIQNVCLQNTDDRCYRTEFEEVAAWDDPNLFPMVSDYNTGRMQQWLESRVIVKRGNDEQVIRYEKWDAAQQNYQALTAQQVIEKRLPPVSGGSSESRATGVPVQAIAISLSNVKASAKGNRVYPLIHYTGNLPRSFDPTSDTERNAIDPNGTGVDAGYCRATGCDYTVRITYDGQSSKPELRVLRGGFRPPGSPDAQMTAAVTNPENEASFRTWVINVDGTKAIKKVEVFKTEKAWEQAPALNGDQLVVSYDATA